MNLSLVPPDFNEVSFLYYCKSSLGFWCGFGFGLVWFGSVLVRVELILDIFLSGAVLSVTSVTRNSLHRAECTSVL